MPPRVRPPVRQRASTRGEKATSKRKAITISGPDVVTPGQWNTPDLVARRDALMEERRKAEMIRRRDELMAKRRKVQGPVKPAPGRPSSGRRSRDTNP